MRNTHPAAAHSHTPAIMASLNGASISRQALLQPGQGPETKTIRMNYSDLSYNACTL
jgi:hypothetical protein